MRISVITSIPWLDSSKSHTQVYREAIEQVRHAEQLGFDCVWFTEHHFATHGINSSVLSFAAYVAGITRRIRIGTAVVVAPLYHPVRLAEEIAQVDIVSDGRLELGIGSGYRFDEFRGLNIAHAESRPMFLEALEILLKAWTGEPFGFKGRHYTVPEGTAVRPTPLQQPHPPIWAPAISMNTIQWVVDSGAHLMAATTFSSISDLRRMRENLDQALSLSKRPEESLEFYVHVPIHVANRSFVELESDLAETFQRFATAAGMGGTIYQQTAGAPQGPFAGTGFNFANYYNNHAVMGSAAECVSKLASWQRELHFTHLTCMFNFGLPHESVMENMERFATQVMPAVREMAACGTAVHPTG